MIDKTNKIESESEDTKYNREEFERIVYSQYFVRSIKKNPNPPQPKISGCLDFISTAMDKSDFLRRDQDGD